MTIWILILLSLAAGASSGRFGGAIRMSVNLIGMILGFSLAVPLSNVLRPHLVSFLKDPITLLVLPPLLVFGAFLIGFNILGQLIHQKVEFYYKYKRSDEDRVLWQRMNWNLGLCLGLVNGAGALIIACSAIYTLGYPLAQTKSTTPAPITIRALTKAHEDLLGSGMHKLAASVDRAPEAFYHGSDVLGLLYHNPPLQQRLLQYPLFLSLSETPAFTKYLAGPETRQALESKVPINRILNTNLTTLLQNKFIASQLAQLDFKDLYDFAKTGASPKYDTDKMIGVWELNILPTVNQIKQQRAEITPVQLLALRNIMMRAAGDISLSVTPDGQLFLRGAYMDLGQIKGILQGRVVARSGGAPDPNAAGQPAGTPAPVADITQVKLIASGTWKREGDNLQVSFKHDSTEATGTLSILNEDNLAVRLTEGVMVFSRYK